MPYGSQRWAEEEETWASALRRAPFAVPERVGRWTIVGHAVVLAVIVLLGFRYSMMTIESNEIGSSFMHLVNLVFHEAGHILFSAFGRFMSILGGSLLQLLVPFVLMLAFALRFGNPFAAAVCLWWLGQSAMDLAPYVNDARAGRLLLLGGYTGREMPGIHDWENILNYLEIIRYDHEIALGFRWGGAVLMLIAVVWAAGVLYLEWRNYDPEYVE